jgi:acyl carrier protein
MKLTQQDLLDYLRDEQYVDVSTIDAKTLLFTEGLLDSMALVEMMTFIMNRTGIEFDASEVTLENLDSVERVLRFVAERATD